MILLDVNVLVRAHHAEVSGNPETLAWLSDALAGDERVAVWDSILISAYRILTLPHLVRSANAPVLAMKFLQEVRDASTVVWSGEKHWRLVCNLISGANATGNLVTDAAIAAVAVENGCRLATFDRDFARFPSLQWFEPQV